MNWFSIFIDRGCARERDSSPKNSQHYKTIVSYILFFSVVRQNVVHRVCKESNFSMPQNKYNKKHVLNAHHRASSIIMRIDRYLVMPIVFWSPCVRSCLMMEKEKLRPSRWCDGLKCMDLLSKNTILKILE